jgi:hypothetical protein
MAKSRVAPIVIHGWDEENNYWTASRDGEPSFLGVQDLGDAYQASNTRGAELIISDGVYAQMVALGEAPSTTSPVYAPELPPM